MKPFGDCTFCLLLLLFEESTNISFACWWPRLLFTAAAV